MTSPRERSAAAERAAIVHWLRDLGAFETDDEYMRGLRAGFRYVAEQLAEGVAAIDGFDKLRTDQRGNE